MARSTYYFEMNKTDVIAKRNEELSATIKEVFENHKGRYGVRRVYRELVNRGYNVNHKRVQRRIKAAGQFRAYVRRIRAYRNGHGVPGEHP